jgi:hypothetical protein
MSWWFRRWGCWISIFVVASTRQRLAWLHRRRGRSWDCCQLGRDSRYLEGLLYQDLTLGTMSRQQYSSVHLHGRKHNGLAVQR